MFLFELLTLDGLWSIMAFTCHISVSLGSLHYTLTFDVCQSCTVQTCIYCCQVIFKTVYGLGPLHRSMHCPAIDHFVLLLPAPAARKEPPAPRCYLGGGFESDFPGLGPIESVAADKLSKGVSLVPGKENGTKAIAFVPILIACNRRVVIYLPISSVFAVRRKWCIMRATCWWRSYYMLSSVGAGRSDRDWPWLLLPHTANVNSDIAFPQPKWPSYQPGKTLLPCATDFDSLFLIHAKERVHSQQIRTGFYSLSSY